VNIPLDTPFNLVVFSLSLLFCVLAHPFFTAIILGCGVAGLLFGQALSSLHS
jgi:hypothetical protein